MAAGMWSAVDAMVNMMGCADGCLQTTSWNSEDVPASCGTLTITKENFGGEDPEDYVNKGCYPTSFCADGGGIVEGTTALEFTLVCDLGWRLAASATAAVISLAYYM